MGYGKPVCHESSSPDREEPGLQESRLSPNSIHGRRLASPASGRSCPLDGITISLRRYRLRDNAKATVHCHLDPATTRLRAEKGSILFSCVLLCSAFCCSGPVFSSCSSCSVAVCSWTVYSRVASIVRRDPFPGGISMLKTMFLGGLEC